MMEYKTINEMKVQLERYQKHRTFVPLSDSEIRDYTAWPKSKNVLNKDYKTILFGEDDKEEWERMITKIIFSASKPADHVIKSSGTSICGDISEKDDDSIIGWVEKSGAEYILHIDGDGKVYAPKDCNYLFSGFSKMKEIEFGDVFDTSQAVNMEDMFWYCRKLGILNVRSFDTQNVTSMAWMFSGCDNLMYLNGEDTWNTSKVTDMTGMFWKCCELRELDLSSFDTRNVTGMECMFDSCFCLEKLDLSSFDTSNVTHMGEMFVGCSSLEKLDLSSFDTSNVIHMEWMFAGCSRLEQLDISNFTFSDRVLYMEKMFSKCEKLNSISAGIKLFEAELYEQSVPLLKQCAYSGNEQAGYLLGICYQKALGVDKDLEKAFQYFESAASKGHVNAMVQTGDCYYEGIGIEQDYKKALEWYQKADEQDAEVDMTKLETAKKMSRKDIFKKLKGLFK